MTHCTHALNLVKEFGPVRFSYNPYFSACFFSRNRVFLSQQIRRNNVSACFFSEANGAFIIKLWFSFFKKNFARLEYGHHIECFIFQ